MFNSPFTMLSKISEDSEVYFEVNLKVFKLTWPILRVSFQGRETLCKNPFYDTFSDFIIDGKSHARIKQIKKRAFFML